VSKVIDRLVDLLPVPLLIACAVVVACGWTIKEIRSLPSNGAVLRDAWFQVGCVIVFAGTVAFYASEAILARAGPDRFSDNERGVYVARFEGDPDNKVQLQAIESLKDALHLAGFLSDVRVVRLPTTLKDTSSAMGLLENSRARVLIWGSFVPPERVHVSIATYPNGGETRLPVDKFPDVNALTSKILEFLQLTPPPAGAKPEDQISFLKRRIELLEQQQSASASLPVAKAAAGLPEVHRLRVLSIGVDAYRSPQFGQLRYAGSDAAAVAELIRQHAASGSTISVLVGIDATKSAVFSALDRISQEAQTDDTVLIYWAGHGGKFGGTSYLVPTDGTADADPTARNTLIPIPALLDWTKRIAAGRVLIMIDSAYVLAEFPGTVKAGQVRALISSAGPEEAAFESSRLGQTIFAHSVLQALSGEADYNHDGVITLSEMFEYVKNNVQQVSVQLGFPQHPALVFQSPEGESFALIRYKP
jgi:hypothetical protein